MASAEQGEKQLFEKFWKGTFKAVATPRPGSVIVASITSRKTMPSSSETPSCPSLLANDKCSEKPHLAEETLITNGCVRLKGSQEITKHKSHSLSCDKEFTPPPTRGKKKKKKSTRKKRRRSLSSCSPSPVKKKKKKKNSKKRKRKRLSSKKRRHSSSSPKSKRKEGRKHKKHSRSQFRKSQRHHRRHCRSDSESSNSVPAICGSRLSATSREEDNKAKWTHSSCSSKRAQRPNGVPEVTSRPFFGHAVQNNSFLSATEVISESGCSADLFKKVEDQLGKPSKRNGEPHEFDSGNDTSSPPFTQTNSSRSKGSQEAIGQIQDGFGPAFSSRNATRGSSSDSGNSFTSCSSQTKGAILEDPTPPPCIRTKDQRGRPLQPLGHSEKKLSPFPSSPPRLCFRSRSSTSRSSPEFSHSHVSHHKAGLRSSQSRSWSSSGTRSYSRSPSYSPKSCRKSPGNRSSRMRRSPSYSRYSPCRDHARDHKHGSSGKESHRHHGRRCRKQSYSPMRKRRRDSPSHLEARRITSARKRPIPYYRPSPSSSSASSPGSSSSWYSSFNHSPSRSFSSRRTSRSRSWSSSSISSRSRSRSLSAKNGRRSSSSRSSESASNYESM